MPQHILVILSWTALLWGLPLLLGLLGYAAEYVWILIEEG